MSDNGLITKIWGPHLWKSLHCIAFGYPENPSKEQQLHYKNFLINLSYVLPCKYCRDSYSYFIHNDPTKLTDAVLANRSTLTKWMYNLHNRVNQKLGINYNVSYDEVVNRYESFRAKCSSNHVGCIMPADMKAHSYLNDTIKDCPVIPINTVKLFETYFNERNVQCDKLIFYADSIKNKTDDYARRNVLCANIISDMRLNGIASIEVDGKYKGLPTIHELKLMCMLCSNLSNNDLIASAKLINKMADIKYKLYKDI